MRAQRWAAGHELPHNGSLQEELQLELSNREKNLDFAKVYVVVTMIQEAFGLNGTAVGKLLDLYEAELHHQTYEPSFIQKMRGELQTARAQAAAAKAAAAAAKARAAMRAAAMEVTDDDLKPQRP